MTGMPVISLIPRDDIVQRCEGEGRTVVESVPESASAMTPAEKRAATIAAKKGEDG